MSLEAELKKFELSSVFTINFSWLKRYVESNNGMYTPMKNISDDEFREIENSLYALQATWKAWREAKAQVVPDTYTPIVLALEDVQSKIAKTSFWTMDEENENEVMAVNANEFAAYIDELIEAQEPAND